MIKPLIVNTIFIVIELILYTVIYFVYILVNMIRKLNLNKIFGINNI